jgi:hypothetical protein
MNAHQPPRIIPCTVCGRGLHLWEIVIVSREVVPPTEQTTTAIVHQTCEPGEGRSDHKWTRDAPQTLLHMLVMMADGRGQHLEQGGAPTHNGPRRPVEGR